MKLRTTPYPMVVSRSRVKHSSLPLRPRPSPRLRFGVRVSRQGVPHLQHRSVGRVMIRVEIRFIPCLQWRNSRDGGMVGANSPHWEHAASMAFEPSANQSAIARFVGKAPTRAMHGNKAAALFDERKQIPPLAGQNFRIVRIEQKRVKTA